jgi:hypothetical protein
MADIPGQTTLMPDGTSTDPGQTVVSLKPVAFNASTLWQSPCFWMVIGSGLTLLAMWTFRKRG